MADPPTHTSAGITDVGDARSRIESIGAAWRLSLITAAATWAYALATHERPGRILIAILIAIPAVLAGLLVLSPIDRVVRSRWREPFFVAWSLVQVGIIAAIVGLDGGGSPLALLFFLPLLFAALSYPLPSVVAVGALTELAYVETALLYEPQAVEVIGFFAVCLACAAVLSALMARAQDRRREAVEMASRTDPLTGVLNRMGLEERLAGELSVAERQGKPLSLVLIDLRAFRPYNDANGHAAGDELLCWVANSLRETARPIDAVGRTDGDEFALLLPGVVRADAVTVSKRLREAVSHRIEAAAGLACCPLDAADAEGLFACAAEELLAPQASTEIQVPSQTLNLQLSWATAFAQAVDGRMAVSHEHSWAVAAHAAGIAEQLKWEEDQIQLLRLAAILHDIGKVCVPDRILRKPGPLLPDEYAEIAQHPIIGADMLRRIEGLGPIVEWVLHSHERVDGAGYPDGLEGDEIPLASRILLVADAFDAMTSARPYQGPQTPSEALKELWHHAGTQFDSRCVAALEAHLTSPSVQSGGESALP